MKDLPGVGAHLVRAVLSVMGTSFTFFIARPYQRAGYVQGSHK